MNRYDLNADNLKRNIRELSQRAEEAEKGHRQQEAASCFLQMAEAYRRLTRFETNVLESTRLHRKAIQCEKRAQTPLVQTEAMPASEVKSYESAVDGLLLKRSNVAWNDIGGMAQTKHDLKYALGLQLAQKPEHLRQLEVPTRILLYGPPGSGKTLLAAAAANMLEANFFNVKVSDLLSKYFGESSKLISALYARARDLADSGVALVFIDEIESLVADRDKSDHGPERRIISTFLAELDGLAEKNGRSGVITIAATNRPWDLDPAILSRMDLRVFVDWPDTTTREAIFRILLEERSHRLATDITYKELAALTEGLTGRAIQRLCKRVILNVMASMNATVPERVDDGSIRQYTVQTRPFRREDFQRVLSECGSGLDVNRERKRFSEWSQHAGTV